MTRSRGRRQAPALAARRPTAPAWAATEGPYRELGPLPAGGPRRWDVGCGAGLQRATVLGAAPGAEGVGVDADADAAALAERTLADRGPTGRARVLRGDVRDLAGGAEARFDLVLLADVVCYVPVGERPPGCAR